MRLSQLNDDRGACFSEADGNGTVCLPDPTGPFQPRSGDFYARRRLEPGTGRHHPSPFDEIIGRSAALMAVLEDVRRVAPTDATVLITGETGTGKELMARAIHGASRRCCKPLVQINCGAMPAGLVESELFGHEKGAFTGAINRHLGRFEVADGGTIFLDEVGELPAPAQVKLLRFLQERTLDRVGGTSPVRVDVRILAATNRELREAVREKAFREDLYYRLNVFPIRLPPLRERRDDVPLLARSLVRRLAERLGKSIDGISAESLGQMRDYNWPGNVRELQNVLERAAILSSEGLLEIDPSALADWGPARSAEREVAKSADLKTVEREHIAMVLQHTRWVVEGPKGAALILGLHPNTLRHRMRKLGIAREAYP